jgi:hypothetical protein
MTRTEVPVIRKQVVVNAPVEQAALTRPGPVPPGETEARGVERLHARGR